jgi:hypothetical protein
MLIKTEMFSYDKGGKIDFINLVFYKSYSLTYITLHRVIVAGEVIVKSGVYIIILKLL